ncbi:MAG: cation-translocating P-type ATPase [Abditibacteriales bacterium]|nr:cation-translocating P-type ATPase [Abditibacteriales bacterium]MDW8365868.1 cation-translocating P-type ATPase [Abditibacteriales bacterium]
MPPGAQALFLLATLIGALPIAKEGIGALLRKKLDAELLVTIAVVGAVSIQEFFAAGEVVFIMLLGEMLESFTVDRARAAISKLMALAPETARVRRDGQEIEIPTDEVVVGDVVVVRPGEKIPVDGSLIAGSGVVDQAAITGESMPVDKNVGDEVFAGTLNTAGAFVLRAERVGKDSTLARITKLVEEAQQRDAPVQRVIDRYATFAVPLMLLIAALTYGVTLDAHRAITVLLVACPCALLLATPTAIVAGIGRAAKEGVLIKGGAHLEAAGRLNVIVFDKTGTLTEGKPAVTDICSFHDEEHQHGEAELIALAAVAEKMSEHPLAQAIREKANEMGMKTPDPSDFAHVAGRGVVANHNGTKIVVGKPALLREHQITLTAEQEQHLRKHEQEGKTVVVVAHDGKPCGIVSIADTLREKAQSAIHALRQLGIKKVVMLTGDNSRTAKTIATQVGIDHVHAEVLPEQKAERIAAFQAQGYRVAMVGDGINDAPALATADVGVAMGASTDIALETADIALVANDLSKVAFAVGLSRKTLAIIKQSVGFALAYNLLMVALAVEGTLGVIGGAVAHQVSGVLVVLNAMRLLRYRQ